MLLPQNIFSAHLIWLGSSLSFFFFFLIQSIREPLNRSFCQKGSYSGKFLGNRKTQLISSETSSRSFCLLLHTHYTHTHTTVHAAVHTRTHTHTPITLDLHYTHDILLHTAPHVGTHTPPHHPTTTPAAPTHEYTHLLHDFPIPALRAQAFKNIRGSATSPRMKGLCATLLILPVTTGPCHLTSCWLRPGKGQNMPKPGLWDEPEDLLEISESRARQSL